MRFRVDCCVRAAAVESLTIGIDNVAELFADLLAIGVAVANCVPKVALEGSVVKGCAVFDVTTSPRWVASLLLKWLAFVAAWASVTTHNAPRQRRRENVVGATSHCSELVGRQVQRR